MKVGIITHKVIKGDGQGRVNYEIVWEAIRRGHHVTLLASSIAPELQQHHQVKWIPISVKGWPTELLRNLSFSWQCTYWLYKHRCDLDLVKVNGAIIHAPGDINAVHFVHSSWLRSPVHTSRLHQNLYGFYQWLYTSLNAYWEKKAFHQAKVIVAVSTKVEKELIEIGVPPQQIQVIFNGVDLQEFFPNKIDRRQLDLPEEVTLAFFAGDLRTPRKNLDTVLHALLKVPTLHLAVAGNLEGSPYPELATKLGLNQRVHFLGYRRDIPKIMQAVDFCVFPSRYEPWGLVLLEAMASGIPTITASTVGGAEILTAESGMILSDPNDIEGLAQALNTLTNHPHLRHQMGQSARAIANKHSWAKMAQSYLDLFEEFNRGI